MPHRTQHLRVSKALAEEIGFNESVVLLQLEFLISITNNVRAGRRWTYQSVRKLRSRFFPWWSTSTIAAILKNLQARGLIDIGNHNARPYDKTQWFALNEEGINRLTSVRVAGHVHGARGTKGAGRQHARLLAFRYPNDTVIRVNRALVDAIGLKEGVILAGIEHCLKMHGEERDGRLWICQSAAEMHRNYVSWWSQSSIKQIIVRLVQRGLLLEGAYPKPQFSHRTRWFALEQEKIDALISPHPPAPQATAGVESETKIAAPRELSGCSQDATIPNTMQPFSPEFKVRIVLDFLTQQRTAAELCQIHQIEEPLLYRWKQEFLERAPSVFATGEVGEPASRIAALERLVGRLILELDMAKTGGGPVSPGCVL